MSAVFGRRLALAALPLATVVALVAAPTASAHTTFAAHTTYYAVGKRACKAPKKAAQATCFADIRVLVKKGTKGARPFVAGGGATGSGTIGPAGGLTPSDLASAYGLTTTGGAGQTVAIVIWNNDPNINADLQTFDTNYGLAACSTTNGCLKVVNQTGGTTLPANDTTGVAVETTLDVESVHSACQGCKIVVVEANSASNADLATAENTAVATEHANEVNNSFGEPEAGNSSTFQAAFNHPGTVITASTGDDGYYNFDKLTATNQPIIPSSYNTVVGVGGTSLYLGQNATRQNETVWNDNGPRDTYQQNLNFGSPLHAEGGGCSTLFPAQGWQTHLSVWSTTACGTKRLDADVSAVGDYLTGLDIYISYNCGGACTTGWQTIGGTSLSSPVTAGIYGLAGGAHGVSYPALTLYGHPGSSYDVTSGGNGWCDGMGAAQCGTPGNPNPNTLGFGIVDCSYPATGTIPAAGDRACDALAGYDGPTGVGTPNGLTMFTATGPTAKISGPTRVSPGTSNPFTATTTDPFPGGSVSSFTWNWGDGTANTVTTTGAASHTYATGGKDYTITLTVKDNYGVTGTATYKVSACCAANGKGTMTTPTHTAVHGSTGNTIVFTYTVPAGGISGGAVTLAVPTGWSAPSITTTAAGYTTSSVGTVSVSGATITVSGLTLASGQTATITYGSKVHAGPGAAAPSTAVGSQTWQAKEKSTAAGTLVNLASSPIITIT